MSIFRPCLVQLDSGFRWHWYYEWWRAHWWSGIRSDLIRSQFICHRWRLRRIPFIISISLGIKLMSSWTSKQGCLASLRIRLPKPTYQTQKSGRHMQQLKHLVRRPLVWYMAQERLQRHVRSCVWLWALTTMIVDKWVLALLWHQDVRGCDLATQVPRYKSLRWNMISTRSAGIGFETYRQYLLPLLPSLIAFLYSGLLCLCSLQQDSSGSWWRKTRQTSWLQVR